MPSGITLVVIIQGYLYSSIVPPTSFLIPRNFNLNLHLSVASRYCIALHLCSDMGITLRVLQNYSEAVNVGIESPAC